MPDGHELLAGAQRRADARRVPVKREVEALGEPPQRGDVLARERGAAGGDRVHHARLVQRDDVHVAFHHEHAVLGGDGLAREVHPVEQPALVVERRVARIEVLGLLVAQRAAGEAHHVPRVVVEREDYAPAHHVHRLAAPPLNAEVEVQQVLLARIALQQRLGQPVGLGGRHPQPELADGGIRQAAPVQVFQRALPVGGVGQLLAVVVRHRLHNALEHFAARELHLLVLAAVLREVHVVAARQQLHHFAHLQVLHFGDELEDVAAGLAAEAVPQARLHVHAERRVLLLVEGAGCEVAVALLLQADVFAEQRVVIHPCGQFVKHARHRAASIPASAVGRGPVPRRLPLPVRRALARLLFPGGADSRLPILCATNRRPAVSP